MARQATNSILLEKLREIDSNVKEFKKDNKEAHGQLFEKVEQIARQTAVQESIIKTHRDILKAHDIRIDKLDTKFNGAILTALFLLASFVLNIYNLIFGGQK